MPVYFPPLPGTSNDADTMNAARTFATRRDLTELSHATLRSFLGFTTSGTSTPDDADAIVASQVFGP